MVSCLGILGAKSVVPSIWVPCVQSNVEAMFHLETDELGCANVALWNSGPRPFTWYKFHSFGVRGCRHIRF